MSKKYLYGVVGIIILLSIIIFVFKNKELPKEKVVVAKIKEYVDKRKYAEQIELILKMSPENKSYSNLVGILGANLISLSLVELNKLFSEAFNKYPRHSDKLNIGWAWVLSRKGEYKKALNKINAIDVAENPFWNDVRQDILNNCKLQ